MKRFMKFLLLFMFLVGCTVLSISSYFAYANDPSPILNGVDDPIPPSPPDTLDPSPSPDST